MTRLSRFILGAVLVAAAATLAAFAPAAAKPLTVLVGFAAVGVTTTRRAAQATDTPEEIAFKDVSNILTYKRPQDSPLYVALRNLAKGPQAQQTEINWHEVSEFPRNTTATSSVSSGGSDATKQIPVDDDIYQVDDLIQLPNNSNRPNAVVQVTQTGDGTITVRSVDDASPTSYGSVPGIANGEQLTRIGNAKKEFYDASPYRSTYPTEYSNYVQRMDEVVGISRTKEATADYAGDSWETQRDNQVYDWQTSRESMLFFGTKQVVSKGQDVIHYMGGIDHYNLPKQFSYSASSLDVNKILDITRQTFVGNTGSDVRYLHAGSLMIQDLMQLDADKLRRDDYRSNLLRREIPEIDMGFGRLRIVHEQLFDERNQPRLGFILDYDNLRLRELNPMKVVRLNLEETQGKDGRAVQLKEECSLEVRYQETHAKVQGSS